MMAIKQNQKKEYPVKRTEHDLRLEAIFNTVIDGIITISEAGVIETLNPAAAKLFNYQPEEVIGKNINVLMPEPYHTRHDRYLQNYFQTGDKKIIGIGREVRGKRKNGTVFPFFLSVSEVQLPDRKIFTGIIHDITDLKKAEQALRESENKLNAIINTAVDGIVTINEQGIINMINPAAASQFGYTVEALIGQNISILMPKNHREMHDAYIERYIHTGERRIIGLGREEVGQRKDGSTFPCMLSISEVQLNDRKLFAGIIHDLTEQKATEERITKLNIELESRVEERTEKLADVVNKLLMTNKALEKQIQERKKVEVTLRQTQQEVRKALEKERELNELKSRFVSMASHEFRTPLSTILSSASLIGRYTTDAEDKRLKHVNRIKSAVNNLTGILNDFLSLSKLEEGRFENIPESFDIVKLVSTTVDEIQGMTKPDQAITYDHIGMKTEVFLDKKFLRNICNNLLSNAIKYSEKEILIRTEIDEDKILLTVKDKGLGIPKEEQQHLFTRFFRAKNATNIQGTGLGLNIVQKYLDLMNGSITFESEVNVGTTFYITFPITKNE